MVNGGLSMVGGLVVFMLAAGSTHRGACGSGRDLEPIDDGGNPKVQEDAGLPDAGSDAGTPDAGTPDSGLPDAGPVGGPGPWPLGNIIYGSAHGILESPIVGTSTDEAQNLWVATHQALYLLKPGQSTFHRYAATDGLHLQTNPVIYCDKNFGGGDKSCPIEGKAADPGIVEIVGGGPGEVFVGYAGIDEGSGDWSDMNRHSGKLDRVRLKLDGTLSVDRFDLVSVLHGAQYWHNRTIQRLLFDHVIHPHELYVGSNHGVDLLRPDHFRKPNGDEWFDNANQEYMGDHLHPRVCYHAPCDDTETNQRMGDWRGLALTQEGNLWAAGRWTAGEIKWDPDLVDWFMRPGDKAFLHAFGDPYPRPANAEGFINEPVFRPPLEGDPVSLSAVSVDRAGQVWFASGPYYGGEGSVAYGVAMWNGKKFTVYDPVKDIGLGESNVRDLIALPDGRLAVAGPTTGVVIWNPANGEHHPLRLGIDLADGQVNRMELDTMVTPPALHVSTYSGASVIRQLP